MGVDEARPRRVGRLILLGAGGLAGAGVLLLVLLWAGALAVAMVAPARDADVWRRWADVGQSFGVFSTVLSGLAFIALVITLWVQMRELSFQRAELRVQRMVAERSGEELRRSADASLRMLHFELLRLSIDDPALARVWPESSADDDPQERRQMVYANLVFQHASMSMVMAGYTDDQIRESLRYLFSSEAMRAYWLGAAAARRRTQQPGSHHWRIARIGDEVCREFGRASGRPGDHPR
jgi:hypothetical protein